MKPYISKPWQCYRCQKFGHNADNCRSNIRCVACAGPHAVVDCPVREKSHVKCTNCGGNHTASYGGCQYIKNARVVEQVRSEKKISYRDAVTLVKSSASTQNNRQVQASHTDAVPSPPYSVSRNAEPVVRQGSNRNVGTGDDSPIVNRKSTEISTQTDSPLLGGSVDLPIFLAKLTAAFVEVINVRHAADTVDQVVAVASIVKSIMGVNIDACEVKSILAGTRVQPVNAPVNTAPIEVTSIPETPPEMTSVSETSIAGDRDLAKAGTLDSNKNNTDPVNESKNNGKKHKEAAN